MLAAERGVARVDVQLTYYTAHPDAYAEVYTTLLDRLSAERARAYGDPVPPPD